MEDSERTTYELTGYQPAIRMRNYGQSVNKKLQNSSKES